ncbi:hypothetical protein QJS10_CPB14g01334 [Acorus calamus]|uniref:Uncharacterized protein n=1 Tax=Acorus calamus TaxID=4465 RepID=A0AAV9DDP9_ACOCL|nr:hypothetical protein QJS10_CPB14g01334 [Acorus calamus]
MEQMIHLTCSFYGKTFALSQRIGSSQWILGGDFNEVRFSHEKIGGKPAHTRRLAKFNKCIADCALQDLKSTGCNYSWSNNQEDCILCRLDRVLVSTSWLNSFPESYVHYDSPGLSDHSPLKHLKRILKHWNNTIFGPVHRALEVSKEKLKETQQAVMKDPRNPSLLAAEKEAKAKYLDQLQMEESFQRQK